MAESESGPKRIVMYKENVSSSTTDAAAAEADVSKIYPVIVMRSSGKYVKSIPGILKLCQVAFLLVALIFVTTAESRFAGYLLLPLDWHLRVFVFVSVFCIMFSSTSYLVHVCRLTDSLRIDWNKFDFIVYCLLCFALLFGSSMVASAIGYYDNLISHGVNTSTKKHLVIGTMFGYISMILYAVSAYYAGRQWKALVLQFNPSRLPSQGPIISQNSSPTTPETTSSTTNIVV